MYDFSILGKEKTYLTEGGGGALFCLWSILFTRMALLKYSCLNFNINLHKVIVAPGRKIFLFLIIHIT